MQKLRSMVFHVSPLMESTSPHRGMKYWHKGFTVASQPTIMYNIMMISGSKGQKAVHACMIKLLNLGPAEHEKVAIYMVNQRIPNVRELREQLRCEAIRGYQVRI